MKCRQCALKKPIQLCVLIGLSTVFRLVPFLHAHVHTMRLEIAVPQCTAVSSERLPLAWHLGVKIKMSTKEAKSAKSRMYIKWLVYPFVSILTHGSFFEIYRIV